MSVPAVQDLTDSRAATDALLAVLRHGHWRPAAVARFLGLATHRSVRQAARRPTGWVQAGALHALLLASARSRGTRAWVVTSWGLTAVHLGLLEDRDRLSAADVITLLRVMSR